MAGPDRLVAARFVRAGVTGLGEAEAVIEKNLSPRHLGAAHHAASIVRTAVVHAEHLKRNPDFGRGTGSGGQPGEQGPVAVGDDDADELALVR